VAELTEAGGSRMSFELLSDADDSPLVRIAGELDMQTIPALQAGVEPIMAGTTARLVLDVSRLDFADSSAIALGPVGQPRPPDRDPRAAAARTACNRQNGPGRETDDDAMNETRSFAHAPASAGAARRFAAELLAAHVRPDALETIQLMVSELATNCIRHTDDEFDLTIVGGADRVRVEATDHGGGEPRKRSPKPTDATGRGLQIVDMLATEWGYENLPGGGKTVWFTLDISAGSPADEMHHARERADRAPERHRATRHAERLSLVGGHASGVLTRN
jgi:anti-sigma regulatory factor (Ser/Thr protein kinase)